jgi:hypothetical protein
VQVVPFQVGEEPPVRARVPQATSTVPFAWSIAVGTAWHSAQATGVARSAVLARWAWCAPTARVEVAVSPRVPAGGAAFVAEPWQVEQVWATTSTTPFTWVAFTTVVLV